jgi:hypothetical protein
LGWSVRTGFWYTLCQNVNAWFEKFPWKVAVLLTLPGVSEDSTSGWRASKESHLYFVFQGPAHKKSGAVRAPLLAVRGVWICTP